MKVLAPTIAQFLKGFMLNVYSEISFYWLSYKAHFRDSPFLFVGDDKLLSNCRLLNSPFSIFSSYDLNGIGSNKLYNMLVKKCAYVQAYAFSVTAGKFGGRYGDSNWVSENLAGSCPMSLLRININHYYEYYSITCNPDHIFIIKRIIL